jgi:hypothetical protein
MRPGVAGDIDVVDRGPINRGQACAAPLMIFRGEWGMAGTYVVEAWPEDDLVYINPAPTTGAGATVLTYKRAK